MGINRLSSFVLRTSIPVYVCAEAGERCHIAILDKYISILPPFAFDKDTSYLKPLGVPHLFKPWYASQPCSENKLSGMVKAMIGITGKMNQSSGYRCVGAFKAGVPEKIVPEQSGDCSVKAVCLYERTTTSQHMAELNILAPTVSNLASTHSNVIQSPMKPDTGGGFSFSSIIGSTNNCVININMNIDTSAGLNKEGKNEDQFQNETF